MTWCIWHGENDKICKSSVDKNKDKMIERRIEFEVEANKLMIVLNEMNELILKALHNEFKISTRRIISVRNETESEVLVTSNAQTIAI